MNPLPLPIPIAGAADKSDAATMRQVVFLFAYRERVGRLAGV